jgi:hypothetical protein
VKSSEPGQSGDAYDHCYDPVLHSAASRLDVYRHERLAFTEPPRKSSESRRVFKHAFKKLKAVRALLKKALHLIIS